MAALIIALVVAVAGGGAFFLTKILREVKKMRVDQIEIIQRLRYLKGRVDQLESEIEDLGAEGSGTTKAPKPIVEFPRPAQVSARTGASSSPGSLEPEEDIAQAPPVGMPPQYLDDSVRSTAGLRGRLREMLGKVRTWLRIDADTGEQDVTREVVVARAWLFRAGVLAIVGLVGWLVASSFVGGMLPPYGRALLVFASGLSLLLIGFRLLGPGNGAMGQGLVGLAIVTCYAGAVMAGPYGYNLFPDYAHFSTFAMMAAVALLSCAVAFKANSLLAAVLGLAGGFGAPLVLKTAQVSFTGLYGYLLILNLVTLAIALRKDWGVLSHLAFILTYVMFTFSLEDYRQGDFLVVVLFLTLFFVIQSSLVLLKNLLERKESTVLTILHMVVNGAMFALFVHFRILDTLGDPYPGIFALLLSLFYAGHCVFFLKKSLVDRKLMIALSAMACSFLALALPSFCDKELLTLGIALLALIYLWLGRLMESNFIQSFGTGLFGLVLVRVTVGMSREYANDPSRVMPYSQYAGAMLSRLWMHIAIVAAYVAAAALQRLPVKVRHEWAVTLENDIKHSIKRSTASNIFYWAAVMTGFLFLLLESNAALSYLQPMRQLALTGLWVCMAIYFLWSYTWFRNRDPFTVSALNAFAIGAVAKLVILDISWWRLTTHWVYGESYDSFEAAARSVDFAVVILMLLAVWRVMKKRKPWLPASIFGYSAVLLAVLYATLELNTLLHFRYSAFQHGGISLLWGSVALVFILAGLRKSLPTLRRIGLFLGLIVAVKIPVADFSGMATSYRLTAALLVGLVMLGLLLILMRRRAEDAGSDAD